jgi:hypothetical protein
MRTIVLAAILVLQATISYADELQDWQKKVYAGLRSIEKFGSINVSLTGTAEKLGLNTAQLTDHLALRFKNNFAGMKYEEMMKPYTVPPGDAARSKIGTLWCHVWTVGDNYPVALHVTCRLGNFVDPDVHSNAVLGYASKASIQSEVKDSLNSLSEEFAIFFFKMRGEM